MRSSLLLHAASLCVMFSIIFPAQSLAQTAPLSPGGATFAQRVTVEALRSKKTRIEGGDFDDKKDRIAFTLKFANGDTRTAFNDTKGEFYVFAESIVNKKTFQLLGVEKFDLSLAPRSSQSVSTEEWETQWDMTGVRFGTKYDSWALVVRDASGAVIFKKASTPSWLPVADKLKTLSAGSFYNRDLKAVNGLR